MTESIKRPALRLSIPGNGNKDGNGTPPRRPELGDYRAIQTVLDTALPPGQQLRTVQGILDALPQHGVAELRRELGAANAGGAHRFLCGTCKSPVYLAQRPAAENVTKDGRAAYFKHYPTEGAPVCSCRTPTAPFDVGAVKFDAQQEGLDHKTLKYQLADCLRADPAFSNIETERRITAENGKWRVPDVSALWEGHVVAFDLQLATVSLADIRERDSFYAANAIKHVWLTDAADLSRLTQQAFVDLHLHTGGRIFAIDDVTVVASLRDKKFQLRELSIVPRMAQGLAIHNVWRMDNVGAGVIFMDPGRRATEGQRRYRDALIAQGTTLFATHRAAIRKAAHLGQGLRPVGLHWDRIANLVHGSNVDVALADDVGSVLAFLAEVERFATASPNDRAATLPALHNRLDHLLAGRQGLHWTYLVEVVCKTIPTLLPALSPANSARLNAFRTTTEKVRPLARYHAAMLSVTFTWLGFRLLVKAPRHLPQLRLGGGRG